VPITQRNYKEQKHDSLVRFWPSALFPELKSQAMLTFHGLTNNLIHRYWKARWAS